MILTDARDSSPAHPYQSLPTTQLSVMIIFSLICFEPRQNKLLQKPQLNNPFQFKLKHIFKEIYVNCADAFDLIIRNEEIKQIDRFLKAFIPS